MNYEEKLNQLNQNLEKAKLVREQANWRLTQIEKEEEQLIEELKELNLTPEELDGEIERLTKEINHLFEQANTLLPKEYHSND